jgi:hypothetical protein
MEHIDDNPMAPADERRTTMSMTDPIKATLVRAGGYEDSDRYCLQIEMYNDFAITLTMMKDGSGPPSTTIWKGNGECAFADYEARGWRRSKSLRRSLSAGGRYRHMGRLGWPNSKQKRKGPPKAHARQARE